MYNPTFDALHVGWRVQITWKSWTHVLSSTKELAEVASAEEGVSFSAIQEAKKRSIPMYTHVYPSNIHSYAKYND